jgi:hypothetical protein
MIMIRVEDLKASQARGGQPGDYLIRDLVPW